MRTYTMLYLLHHAQFVRCVIEQGVEGITLCGERKGSLFKKYTKTVNIELFRLS